MGIVLQRVLDLAGARRRQRGRCQYQDRERNHPWRECRAGDSPYQGGSVPRHQMLVLTRDKSASGTRVPRPDLAPDLTRDLDDALKLVDLLLDADAVALDGRGEAALRAEGELVERHVFRGLVDPTLELVGTLQHALLRGDEAEYDHLALGYEAERGEAAGARRVVLQEVAVDLDLVEENLGHGIVATLGDPAAFEITAAEMHGDGHVPRPARDRAVDQPRVSVRQLLGILADAAHLVAQLRIAEIGEVHLIELQVGKTALCQSGHLLTVDAAEVGVELGDIGVGLLVYGLAAAAEMDGAGGGNADLGHRCLHRGLQEGVVLGHDPLRVAELAVDPEARGHELEIAFLGMEARLHARRHHGDVGELLEEIEVPEGAAELAVGRALEAHVLLQLHDLSDALVLDLAERCRVDLATLLLLARVQQAPRTEQAPDMIGSERRLSAAGHKQSPGYRPSRDLSTGVPALTRVLPAKAAGVDPSLSPPAVSRR